MNQKQRETIAWLKAIEQFSNEQSMPMRIMDNIKECIELVESKEPDWEMINNNIEGILESIAGKTEGEMSEKVLSQKGDGSASAEEVKDYVMQMIERGYDENVRSVDSIAGQQENLIRECYRKICEISTVKAHLEEMDNSSTYCHFFETIKSQYEQDYVGLGKSLIEDVGNNCSNMMEHIRSMFQNIGGRKIGVGNKEFYVSYDEKKDGIDRKFSHEVESIDFNGEAIIDFSKKTSSQIDKIKNKNKRKRRFWAALPILILLGIGLTGIITFSVRQRSDKVMTSETEQPEGEEDSVQEILALAQQFDEISDNVQTMEMILAFLKSSIPVIVEILVLILIAYVAYVIFLGKHFREKMLNECGEYLKIECKQFEADNLLGDDGQLEKMVEEYEQEYTRMLQNVFCGSELDPLSKENQRRATFSQLSAEWSKIKYQ